MSRTRIGRQVYALGGNPEAASRIGINILGVQLFAYGYLGFLAARRRLHPGATASTRPCRPPWPARS